MGGSCLMLKYILCMCMCVWMARADPPPRLIDWCDVTVLVAHSFSSEGINTALLGGRGNAHKVIPPFFSRRSPNPLPSPRLYKPLFKKRPTTQSKPSIHYNTRGEDRVLHVPRTCICRFELSASFLGEKKAAVELNR